MVRGPKVRRLRRPRGRTSDRTRTGQSSALNGSSMDRECLATILAERLISLPGVVIVRAWTSAGHCRRSRPPSTRRSCRPRTRGHRVDRPRAAARHRPRIASGDPKRRRPPDRPGVVLRRTAGSANLYQLNRDHVAASWIEGLATLPPRSSRDSAMRSTDGAAPTLVVVFGSVARGDATPQSDLDLLVVRPASCDQDDPDWRKQLSELQRTGTAWTGNDTRILEFGEHELQDPGQNRCWLTRPARASSCTAPCASYDGQSKPWPADDAEAAQMQREHDRWQARQGGAVPRRCRDHP